MAVSERDKERMRRLGEASAALEEETGAATEAQRRWAREFINPKRAEVGLWPLEDEEEPPELEFVRKARARGMLRRRRDDA